MSGHKITGETGHKTDMGSFLMSQVMIGREIESEVELCGNVDPEKML